MHGIHPDLSDRPSAPITPPSGDLPKPARDQLRYRVRVLVTQFGLSREDREDLMQEAQVRLLVAMKKHDPSKASEAHFARAVLDYWAADRARRLRKERLRNARRVLSGSDPAAEPSDIDELREEVALFRAFVAETTPALAPVLNLLGTRSITGIATALGIDRVTVHRRIRRLQSIGRTWAALTGRPPGWHLGGDKF